MEHATPSFFKIINSPTEDLRVPPEFVRQHGKDLGANSTVFLRVPNGLLKWEVEYATREPDGEVWFEKGWKRFTEHYSVSYGYFLIFDYKSYSNFSVLIFDLSATEIDYSSRPLNLSEQSSGDRKRGRKAASFAMERAKGFKSENPFCIVGMQPSYVNYEASNVVSLLLPKSMDLFYLQHGLSFLFQRLPLQFYKRILGTERAEMVLVSCDDGRVWNVRCVPPNILFGWPRVVMDSNLKVGDTCVFELVDKNVIKLFIFPSL